MGASLIGYHLVGPNTLAPARLERAQRRMRTLARIAATPDEERTNHQTKMWKALLDEITLRMDHDGADELDAKAREIIDQGEELVESFAELWRGQTTRVSIADIGNGRCAVFTGAMSWGDSPEHPEYRTVADAMMAGITWIVGVR